MTCIGVGSAAIAEACTRYRCTEAELLSKSKREEFVAARRLVAIRLRACQWSLPRIGRVLHRHHTTVLALLRRAK